MPECVEDVGKGLAWPLQRTHVDCEVIERAVKLSHRDGDGARLSMAGIVQFDIGLALDPPVAVPVRFTMTYEPDFRVISHRCDGLLSLVEAHVRRVGVLHAHDMIARIDVQDFAGDPAAHVRQQIRA